jgi:hypothetical protein
MQLLVTDVADAIQTGQAPSLHETVLVFEGETVLFNDGIGQNFARDPLYFGVRFVLGDSAVESNFEILSLSYLVQTLITNLGQGAMDGLSLRIQNALL